MGLGQFKVLAVAAGVIALSGCSSQIAFNKTFKSCEAPASSARYGANQGPIILTPMAESAFNTNVTVTGTCVTGSAVTVSGAGIANQVNTACPNGTFSAAVSMNNGEGSKEIDVSQMTAADGGSSVDRLCVLQDTIPPQVTISAGPGAQSVNTNTLRIEGTCESGLNVVITGPNIINTVVSPCVNGSYSGTIVFVGGDGLKDVVARQVDPAGNGGQDQEQYRTDTTPPIVTINSPAAMTATQGNLTLSGNCETGTRVVLTGGISGIVMSDCLAGSYSAALILSAGDGIKNVVASQTDVAGNAATANRNYVKDSTAPAIRITSPNANAVTDGSFTLAGTCETGLTVNLSGTGLSAPINTTCSAGTFSANVSLSTPDGAKNIIATQTDSVGNVGSDNRSFIRDTTGPAIAITSPAANAFVPPSAAISGTCETGLTVAISGSGVASSVNTNCVSGNFSASVTFTSSDGNKQVIASQTDAVGNSNSSTRTFRRDGTAPALAITSPAANSYIGATATISGTCETGLDVILNGTGITSPVTATCAGGTFSAIVATTSGDGSKNVVATQTDGAGNATSVNRSFLRDGTAPVVAILSPSTNSYVAATATISGSCETGLNVTLNGSGVSTPVVALCVDSAFSALVTFSPGDGSKNVVASQTDAAGNNGSNNRSFIRDSTAPAITITSPAANAYVGPSITLAGTCENGLIVNVSGTGITAPTTTSCSSGTYSVSLTMTNGDGNKEVTVSQTDGGGSTGSDSRIFRRDTTAPVLAITSPLANSYVGGTATITGTCEAGVNVVLSGTGLTSSVSTNCNSGTFSSLVTFTGGDGSKNVVASQTDAAGNTGSTNRSFLRDGTAPLVAITSPAANSYVDNTATINGTCESGLNVTLAGSGLSAPVTAACTGGLFSTLVNFTSGDGSKQVTASQTDAAGNTGNGSRTFVRDATGPLLAITSPAVNSFVGATATISGTCETGLNVVLSGTGLASSVSTMCAAGAFSAVVSISAGDGTKQVTATQTDGAGNSSTDSRNFVRDSVGPSIAITSPAANSYVGSTATISGTCETGLTVTLNGAGMTGSVNANCVAGAFSGVVTISAGDGGKVITASQTDTAGNTNSNSRTFLRDTTAPVLAFTSPAANSFVSATTTVSGTCETGLTVTLSGSGVMSPVTANCTSGAFTADVSFTIGDGSKQVTASQTDAAGNTGTASRNFTRDGTAPVVAIVTPATNSFVGPTATISGTCETGLTVTLSGTGLSAPVNANCVGGNFSTSVTFSSGDGSKQVTASQTDGAGNSGSDSSIFRRDTVGPAIAITSPAANSYLGTTATIDGTCETGFNVTLNGAGMSGSVTVSCVAGAFSGVVTVSAGDGPKVITASQTDAAGNTSSNSRTFLRDTTAPMLAFTSPGANSNVGPTATVTGTCETGFSVTLGGAGVASPVVVNCVSGTFSGSVSFTSGDGSKQVTASQTDAAGNTGNASRNFNRDSAAPLLAITSPAANSFVGPTATVSGTCETGLTVTLSGTGLAASTTASCTGGNFNALVTFSSGDGNKQVTASQTDSGGNTGTDSRTFRRDTTGPVIAITSPAAGSYVGVTAAISGTCETGTDVTLAGSGVSTPVVTPCSGGTFSAVVSITSGDGSKQVTASQTDTAGNTSSTSRSFLRDGTAPILAITSPASNSFVALTASISGTCETGITVVVAGSGVVGSTNGNCVAGTFTASVTFTAGDGSKQVTASQTDGAGNTGTASRNFVRDGTAPLIAITAPAANTAVPNGLTISGTCETGLTVTISGDVVGSPTAACVGGVFSVAIAFSGNVGAKNVVASQTDNAGNTGSDSRSFIKQNSNGLENFIATGPGGMVDILFVNDNSASMDPEQAALANRFSSFTDALSSVDWQVGMITTDCLAGSDTNFCGQLYDFAGRPGEYILNESTPDYLNVFRNTIQRPETINCIADNSCPSGREEGLKSTIEAINRRNTDNAGFFRNGADLAVVMLTDENEQSNGPVTATTPQAVVNAFNAVWGATKKFSNYSIIIEPGDASCLGIQRAQSPDPNIITAFYGTFPANLSALTGGLTYDICQSDYSLSLTDIAENVTRLTGAIDLAQVPISGTVNVTFNPPHVTTWNVNGNRITFAVPAPAGTQVTVSYEY